MRMRIFTMSCLLAGFFLGGVNPTLGQSPASPSESDKTSKAKTDKATPQEKESKKAEPPKSVASEKKPATKNNGNSLKASAKKYRFRWSDEKLSDLPLVIELLEVTVPQEIQGPFPADAEWRVKEPPAKNNSEKKPDEKPEKKSGGGFWPWS